MMTVLSVAYPLAPVRPDTAGGAEQVLSTLDAAMAEAGERSIVIAPAGSKTEGTLVRIPPPGRLLDEQARRNSQAAAAGAIKEALGKWPIDLVHMHGIDFDRYLPPEGVPVLVTLHLPPGWYGPEALAPKRPHTYLVCVSAFQRRSCPESVRGIGVIENGVPVGNYGREIPKKDFALILGRICPEKGVHLGIEAACEAGISLIIAGGLFPYPEHLEYFRRSVQPCLDGTRCRFLGPVGGTRKATLLGEARCLLVPSLAPETSSLAAMEAMASGTPVVAFRSGALPEIVDEGRTGFLVADTKEMAEAVRRADGLDREACRETARRRFSAGRMTEEYFTLYRRIKRGELETEGGEA